MKLRLFFILTFAAAVLFLACKKDSNLIEPKSVGSYKDSIKKVPVDTNTVPVDTNKVPVDTTGAPPELEIKFSALVNNSVLIPESAWYTNTSGDRFTVTKFNYYISNIKLKRSDGSVYSERESYHLIKHVEGKNSFVIDSLPPGKYVSMTFLIGVDSLRNVSGAQSGDLDPANNMFWEWNTGYIFFKLEGAFESAEIPSGSNYGIHIGGFEGKFGCLQNGSLSFPTPVEAKNKRRSKLYINSVIDEVFMNPNKIGFDYYFSQVSTLKIFQDVSVNYVDMFVFDRVEN